MKNEMFTISLSALAYSNDGTTWAFFNRFKSENYGSPTGASGPPYHIIKHANGSLRIFLGNIHRKTYPVTTIEMKYFVCREHNVHCVMVEN